MMYSCSFRIEYEEETNLVGCLRDSVNIQDFGMTLKESLTTMFTSHKAGVLIATSKSLGVMNYDDKYYFTNSHACGPKGASASDTQGKACIIECSSLDDLVRVCKRATGSCNVQYTLNYIDIQMTEPEPHMTDDELLQARRAMNVGQKDAFVFITKSILEQLNNHSDERLRLFITGNAGTGKTFLFNLLKNQVNRCYSRQVVKVCALTGVAARLVGGSTLHSTLKLPVQKDGRIVQMPILTGNYLRLMRQQWQHIEFLFIDEISMVLYEMLCMVDSRLKQLKNNELLLGGINICVFGDLMPLPPVRGNQVFDQPFRFVPATHLWRSFSLIELTENMRQQGSYTFKDLSNALRIGELQSEHFAI
jgi:hypothetical protein